MTQNNHRLFPIALVGYEMAMYLANDTYLPAFPQVAQTFSSSHYLVQLSLSLFCLGMLVTQFILGFFAEYFGRRTILLGGGLVFIGSTITCAIAPTIAVLLVARFFQGATITSMMIAGYATVHELFSRDKAIKTLAWMGSVTILAPALGPLLGSILLLVVTWRWTFALLAIMASLPLVVLYYKMPETQVKTAANQKLNILTSIKHYQKILTNVSFLRYTLAGCFLFASLMSWIAIGPFLVISHFHYSPTYFGWFQLIVFAGFILGNHLVKALMNEARMQVLINVGLSLVLAASIMATLLAWVLPQFLLGTVLSLFILTTGVGLCSAIFNRLAIEACNEPMGARMTVYSSCTALTATLSTSLVGWITQGQLLPFAGIMVTCAVLAALSYYSLAAKAKPV